MINKSDREGSDRTFTDLMLMLETGRSERVDNAWIPPVLKTEAVNDRGVTELLEEIEKHLH